MRKLIVIISIMFGAQSMEAQRYIQFEQDANFIGQDWSVDGWTLQVDYEEFSEQMIIEISVDSMVQHGQLVTYFSNDHDIKLYANENSESILYLWEDTLTNLLMGIYPHYYPELLSTKSVVIYDYNQTVGDTVNSGMLNLSSEAPFVIINVDTIDYSGIARASMFCQSTNGSQISFNIIEGLGTDLGFLTNVDEWIEGGESMECGNFDGIHVFGGNGCFAVINENQVNIHTSPNPFQDNLNIQFSEHVNGVLSIIDVHGKICHQEKLSSISKTLNLEKLNSGLFLFNIINEDGVIVVYQKIMKQ